MKFRLVSFLFLFLFVFLFACDSGNSETENLKELASKHHFTIEFLNKGQVFFGDTLQLKINTQAEEIIKEISIFSDTKVLKTITTVEPIFLNTSSIGGGEKQIVVSILFNDGKEKTEKRNVIILSKKSPPTYTYEIIKKYPHDISSYTQGLEWYKSFLVEGTGNYNQSKLRKIQLINGMVEKEINVENNSFGEGITIFDNKIYQLTYKEKKVFVYDANTFEKINEFEYASETNEGWGLTHNDTNLIFSDGSAYLFFCDPATFKIIKKIKVFDNLKEVTRLNELELHNGKLYANIYGDPFIAEIDPATGEVIAYINLTNLLKPEEIKSKIDVLNGIAINENTGNLLVTGKWWPIIFEIKTKKIENTASN